jgi:uncharacterized protein GlcG (DUF336 family)
MWNSMRLVTELDDAAADAAVDAAVAAASRLGIAVSVAVVDRGGRLKRFSRMDGAEIAGVTLAPDKAFSAVANSCDTDELARQAAGDLRGIEQSFTIVAGGAVIADHDGTVVGAVGVSGGTADQDRECARAGVAATTSRR